MVIYFTQNLSRLMENSDLGTTTTTPTTFLDRPYARVHESNAYKLYTDSYLQHMVPHTDKTKSLPSTSTAISEETWGSGITLDRFQDQD